MAKNFKSTNLYTVLFAVIMVVVVATLLAFTASSLKPMQKNNVQNEKRQNILKAIGIDVDRENASVKFDETIKKQIAINSKGKVVIEGKEAFNIDFKKELAKPENERQLPLFEAEVNGETLYIIPLRGTGLWGPIWGFISINNKFVEKGITFDHAAETPGLGAEITMQYFLDRFKGEHLKDANGEFQGITVKKGNGDPSSTNKKDNAVDAIAGATITGDGVTKMLQESIAMYLPYLNKQ